MLRRVLILLVILTGALAQPTGSRVPTKGLDNLKQLDDFEFLLYDKKKLVPTKLSDITRHNKILVIDFWATWCGPCRKSLPALIELQDTYKDRGVEIIGLSTEDPLEENRLQPAQKNKAAVAGMVKEFAVNYPVGFATEEMFRAFDRTGVIPQTFIFGRDGVLIKHVRGFSSERAPKIWRESIEAALQQAESGK